MATKYGKIRVTVVRGDHLVAMNPGGTSNPFVTVTIGSQSQSTDVQEKTCNPTFTSPTLVFDGCALPALINVNAYNKVLFTEMQDLLGSATCTVFNVATAAVRKTLDLSHGGNPTLAAKARSGCGSVEISYTCEEAAAPENKMPSFLEEMMGAPPAEAPSTGNTSGPTGAPPGPVPVPTPGGYNSGPSGAPPGPVPVPTPGGYNSGPSGAPPGPAPSSGPTGAPPGPVPVPTPGGYNSGPSGAPPGPVPSSGPTGAPPGPVPVPTPGGYNSGPSGAPPGPVPVPTPGGYNSGPSGAPPGPAPSSGPTGAPPGPSGAVPTGSPSGAPPGPVPSSGPTGAPPGPSGAVPTGSPSGAPPGPLAAPGSGNYNSGATGGQSSTAANPTGATAGVGAPTASGTQAVVPAGAATPSTTFAAPGGPDAKVGAGSSGSGGATASEYPGASAGAAAWSSRNDGGIASVVAVAAPMPNGNASSSRRHTAIPAKTSPPPAGRPRFSSPSRGGVTSTATTGAIKASLRMYSNGEKLLRAAGCGTDIGLFEALRASDPMLSRGFESVRDYSGRGILHIAAWHGQTEVLQVLLRGGGPNATPMATVYGLTSRNGNTMLHSAVYGGHAATVEWLLLHPALQSLASQRNARGMLPVDCAIETGNKAVLSLFRR